MAALVALGTSVTLDTWRVRVNEIISRFNALGESSAIVITGGTINGTAIGGSAPSTGTFTNLTVNSTLSLSSATIILADNQISGDKISGGTIDVAAVELTNPVPTQNNHAARKDYVDAVAQDVTNASIAFAIVFGG